MLTKLSRDDVDVSQLERIYELHSSDTAFVHETLSAMRQLDEEHAWRAAWLLRRFTHRCGLGPAALIAIAREATGLDHWVSRLLLCQLFADCGCPPRAREALFPFLRQCAAHRTPFVRAWAYSALRHFVADPRYRAEVTRLLRAARADKAKSVQARLRQMSTPKRRRPAARRTKTTSIRN